MRKDTHSRLVGYSQFSLSDFLGQNEKFHIARVDITSQQDLSGHTHDYAEMFWIEKGHGFHSVNGAKVKIAQGDLVMMRPQDRHTFIPAGRGITLINIAFAADTLDHFRQRYFPDSAIYYWTADAFPFQIRLSQSILHRISARAEEAIKYSRSNIQLDSLLLFIFRQITANERVENLSDIPLWLFNAIQQFNSPELFQHGTDAFVGLCDRNVSYVNRMVRAHFGKTLTELVNGSKMSYAATQLSLTGMPIKEICSNCGFSNIGHFYKVFRQVYDQTPKEYRRVNQTVV